MNSSHSIHHSRHHAHSLPKTFDDSRKITQELKNSSLDKIKQIWKDSGNLFNLFHYSAAFTQLRNLSRQRPSNQNSCHQFGQFLAERCVNANLHYNPKFIAISASALHALNIREKKLFGSFADYFCRHPKRLQELDSKEIAMLANGFSTQEGEFGELFSEINHALLSKDDQGKRILDSCNSQNLNNIANAFSKQDGDFPDLFHEITKILLSQNWLIDNFSNLDCTMLINAFLERNEPSKKDLFRKINGFLLKEQKTSLILCDPKDIVVMLSSHFEKWEQFPKIFSIIYKHHFKDSAGFQKLTSACSPRNLAMVLHSLSQVQERDATVFCHFADLLLKNGFSQYDAENLVTISGALARMSTCLDKAKLRELFSKILEKLTSKNSNNVPLFETLPCKDLVALVWAYSLTNLSRFPNFSIIQKKTLDRLEKGEAISDESLFSLHQIQLAIQKNLVSGWSNSDFERLSGYLHNNKCSALSQREIHSSSLQKAIFNEIKKKYPDCIEERSIEGLMVDIFLPKEKCVIEVNGPYHYIKTETDSVLDFSAVFKEELLGKMGYTARTIKYSDWEALTTDDAKSAFIDKLMRTNAL